VKAVEVVAAAMAPAPFSHPEPTTTCRRVTALVGLQELEPEDAKVSTLFALCTPRGCSRDRATLVTQRSWALRDSNPPPSSCNHSSPERCANSRRTKHRNHSLRAKRQTLGGSDRRFHPTGLWSGR